MGLNVEMCAHHTEVWRDIDNYSGLYQVSNQGRVKGLNRQVVGKDGRTWNLKEKVLVPYEGGTNEYLQVSLSKDSKSRKHLVHRLVAKAFIKRIPTGMEVNHINGRLQDNRLVNLEIVTHQENIDHSVASGLKNDYGEKHTNSKLSNAEASLIRKHHLNGMKQVDLARQFGVSKQTINNIVHNKSYFR